MRSKLIIVSLLVLLVALAGCGSKSVSMPTAALTTVPTVVTPAATSKSSAKNQILTVLAAASLTEPFKELGQQFEAKNPGVTVEFSFAGSQALAQQLGQGAQADVFASASPKYMDAVVAASRVVSGSARIFVRNRPAAGK
jgi:molybdate transport system substrate-binding protein